MRTVTFTTEQIAQELLASIGLKIAGFISTEEHLAMCRAWRQLFGDEFFKEAIEIAKNGKTYFDFEDGTSTFYDTDVDEFVNITRK